MGYYSTFNLRVRKEDGSKLTRAEFNPIVEAFRILGIINYALDEGLGTYENVKWYEYRTHIAFVSKLFPEYLFTLKREGEEPGDHEQSFFKNGKIQMTQARLVYDEFNEDELKEVDLGDLEKEFEECKAQKETKEAEEARKAELLASMSVEDRKLLGL